MRRSAPLALLLLLSRPGELCDAMTHAVDPMVDVGKDSGTSMAALLGIRLGSKLLVGPIYTSDLKGKKKVDDGDRNRDRV